MTDIQLSDHLLGRDAPPDEYIAAMHHATELAATHIYEAEAHSRADSDPSLSPVSAHDIDLDTPLGDTHRALDELRGLWLDRAVYYHHDRYMSHLNCPVAVPAVAADALASSMNTAVESWDQATAAIDIEQRLISWMASKLGMGPEANGVFTSGGTQSNLQALTIARNKARRSAGGGAELAVLASPEAHYSVARATDLLGLPAPIPLPTDSRGRICADGVAKEIEETRNGRGLVPAAVVATAGTTDRGIVDPLGAIAEVCAAANVHFHVDAAFGGAAALAPRSAALLDGIGAADTVTVDFHKTFFQPVACSAVIARDHRDLAHVRWNAEYLNPADATRVNLADYSLQTTRRFDALKLWVTLRSVGSDAIGRAFDTCVDTARGIAELIDADPRFELFEPPQLSTVLFSLSADPAGTHTEYLRDALFTSGEAAVAITRSGGRRLVKFTIVDPSLGLAEVRDVLDAIDRTYQGATHD